MPHNPTITPGSASSMNQEQYCFQACSAARQFPPVIPRTNKGATSVHPKMNKANINQGVIPHVTPLR